MSPSVHVIELGRHAQQCVVWSHESPNGKQSAVLPAGNHAGVAKCVQPSGQEAADVSPAAAKAAAQSGVAAVFVAVPVQVGVRLASVPHAHSCSPPVECAEPAYSVTFSTRVCSTSFSTLSAPASTSASGGNGKESRWSS